MTDHRQETAADSRVNGDLQILLLAGSRAGKGRSIIWPDRFDGSHVVDPDNIDPKPTIGADDDFTR